MAHVVCVGDLLVDVLARLPGPLAPGSDTPAPIALTGGGAAANVAAWLVAADARASFVGRVGADALGRQAVAELEASGVECAVSVDPVRATGTCIVLVDPDGERTMIPDAGANGALAEAAAVLPSNTDTLYVSGYALLKPGARPFALAMMRLAREAGIPIAVDAASAAPLRPVAADFADWTGPDVLLFANRDEAQVLPLDRFAATVIKHGASGAVWSDGAQEVRVPAVAVDAAGAVDSTGAGDAFAAGYLASEGGPRTRLEAGAALAARAVAQVGARPREASGRPRPDPS